MSDRPSGAALLNAALLATSIQDALDHGVRHYNRAGKLLTTAVEILETLRDEGVLTLEEPKI